LSPDTNSDGDGDGNSDGDKVNKILDVHTNPQSRPDAMPWAPSIDTLARSFDPVEIALALAPGLVYDAFYSPVRQYTGISL